MRRFVQLGFLFSGIAGLGAVFALASEKAPPPASLPTPAGAPEDHGFDPAFEKSATWMGVATCASTSCHNENGRNGAPRSEYSTWKSVDYHSTAFSHLFDERSDDIMHNLYGIPKTVKGSAAREPLCLKCHSSYTGNDQKTGDRFSFNDGVGCESCHGPAEKWLSTHFQAGFKEMSLEDKAALGMRPTKDLTHRAKLCVTCHVGNADKEVNHDLIAAGHPRLNFELAGFHANYHRHWLYADEKARHPDFEARLWAIGQATTARASLELLQARAEGASQGKKPWPEFAEYDCFACHKSFVRNSPTQQGGYPGRSPGAFPWGSWNFNVASQFARHENVSDASIAKIRKLMQESSPDPAAVNADASRGVAEMTAWLKKLQASGSMSPQQIRSLLNNLADVNEERAKALTWDETCQLYLAFLAMHRGLADLEGKPTGQSPALEALGERLRQAFPKATAGSRVRWDNPQKFDPSANTPEPLWKQIEAIRRQSGN